MLIFDNKDFQPNTFGQGDSLRAAQQNSLRERIHGRTPALGAHLPISTHHNVFEAMTMNWEQMAALNYACRDILVDPSLWHAAEPGLSSNTTWRHWVQIVLDNKSISTCGDLRSMGLCGPDVGTGMAHIVRWLCSETCDCGKPDSIVPSMQAKHGCPQSCHTIIAVHTDKRICEDVGFKELQASEFWRSWVSWLRDTRSGWSSEDSGEQMQFADALFSLGCNITDVLPKAGQENNITTWRPTAQQSRALCDGETPMGLRPLNPICPVSCGCSARKGGATLCPKRCTQKKAPQPAA